MQQQYRRSLQPPSGAGTDSSGSYSSPVRYLDANESLQVDQKTLFNTVNDTKVEHVPIGISE